MRKKNYQKPIIKVKRLNLNMFYRRIRYKDGSHMYLGSCSSTNGVTCGNSCGSDCVI